LLPKPQNPTRLLINKINLLKERTLVELPFDLSPPSPLGQLFSSSLAPLWPFPWLEDDCL